MNDLEIAEPRRQSDDLYRLLFEAITDYAIYVLDPNGIISNWNAGAQRFKGYRAEEVVGTHFSRFYRAEDRANGLPTRALETAATQGKFEAEGWRVRKDGTQFWAHVVIDPIRGASGEILGFAKITRDLTERRAAEQSLRNSQEQFRLLVQSVTDYAIYMIDPTGHVSSWNAGAERIKGYAPDEIIGSHFSRFYTAPDIESGLPDTALETARSTGRFAAEGKRIRKDGTEFRASVVIDAVWNDAGELIGFAKITRDVTERDAAQRELERAREALFQSQKMEAIGQLTGGIAHDFNNLLMAILSSLELLGKRLPADPMMQKLVNNAVQGAQRGATLTQRMLAFARRQELTTISVDIPKTVMGMADLLERSLGPAWSIETRFPLNIGAVSADINQLEMALLNLVVNARDAMPDGGTITIQAREHSVSDGESPQLKAGKYVNLSVSDTGTGMDAATLARAMEPFFTTKGVGKGTGLGLSMIHGFADQLNGTFLLKSISGKGTTAEIWLPTAETVPVQSGSEAIVDAPAPIVPRTILAVDDDPLILMNTGALLEDMGHTVFLADTGEEALSIFVERPEIELVITDHAMPGMTGMELAKALRDVKPDIAIILATGFGEMQNRDTQPVMRLGKPFSQADLRKSVAEALAVI
ncbi:MAG: Histidine kinase [Sphingomonadales bacterium]|nr:Histidine kinase [Sphingomonadales bacterium]